METLRLIDSNFNFLNILTVFCWITAASIIFEKSLTATLKLAGCFFVLVVTFLGLTHLGMNNTLSYLLASLIAIQMAHFAEKETK